MEQVKSNRRQRALAQSHGPVSLRGGAYFRFKGRIWPLPEVYLRFKGLMPK